MNHRFALGGKQVRYSPEKLQGIGIIVPSLFGAFFVLDTDIVIREKLPRFRRGLSPRSRIKPIHM
jgi:hypothetical protein